MDELEVYDMTLEKERKRQRLFSGAFLVVVGIAICLFVYGSISTSRFNWGILGFTPGIVIMVGLWRKSNGKNWPYLKNGGMSSHVFREGLINVGNSFFVSEYPTGDIWIGGHSGDLTLPSRAYGLKPEEGCLWVVRKDDQIADAVYAGLIEPYVLAHTFRRTRGGNRSRIELHRIKPALKAKITFIKLGVGDTNA